MHGTGTECLTESSPSDAMHGRNLQHDRTGAELTREKGIKKIMSRERFTSIFVLFDKLYFVERTKTKTKIMKLLLRAVTKTTGDGVRAAASRARARFHSAIYLQIYQTPRGDPLPTHRPRLASLPEPHLLISECVCVHV
ncbi:unnamed protein product [Boreogadus saida]